MNPTLDYTEEHDWTDWPQSARECDHAEVYDGPPVEELPTWYADSLERAMPEECCS